MRLLALDVGDKRIGVAMCDPDRILASPLTTLMRQAKDKSLDEILQIARENDVAEIVIPSDHAVFDSPRQVRLERRVDERGPNAGLAQGSDLILHQGDERRNDDANAVSRDGRDLVAETLAASGRHQYECITAADDAVDDLFLLAPELPIPEDVFKDLGRRPPHGFAQIASISMPISM